MDDPTEGQYDMIIGRNILMTIEIQLKIYTNTVECGTGPYKVYTTLMVYLNG